MAIEIDATLSGAASNSYVTVIEADDYFAGHFVLAKATLWSGLSEAQKKTLLRLGASIVESLPMEDNAEYRRVSSQSLTFPRNVDHASGVFFVPQDVKDAQCEQAVYLATMDEANMVAQMQGIWEESVSADGVSTRTTYSGGGGSASMLSPFTFALLKSYVRRGSSTLRRA